VTSAARMPQGAVSAWSRRGRAASPAPSPSITIARFDSLHFFPGRGVMRSRVRTTGQPR
jgi:hypothetical protein